MILLILSLGILLATAALCFGLNRIASTRILGFVAAGATLLAAIVATLAPPRSLEQMPIEALRLGAARFSFWSGLVGTERAVALALLGGGSAALLSLASGVSVTVRGFGTVFGWALISLAAALLSIVTPPLSLVQPLAWAVLALAGYSSIRASGATIQSDLPPLGVAFGLGASALLMAALIVVWASPSEVQPPAWPTAVLALLAVLGLTGGAPFMLARDEAAIAPAPLGALIFGLGAPAAGLGWLLRALSSLAVVPDSWGVALGLIGGVSALACSAAALGEQRLRPLLLRIWGAQAALVVAAIGLAGPHGAIAGSSLLIGAMLGAVAGAAAAASLERHTGSDDYTVSGIAAPRLALAGWVIGAGAGLGLPPLWSFWGMFWFLVAAQEQRPWLAALTLATLVLQALALLAPLAAMLGPGRSVSQRATWAEAAPVAAVGAGLLGLGILPHLAWTFWLREIPEASPTPPVTPEGYSAALIGGGLLAALVILLTRARSERELTLDRDEEPVRLSPVGLSTALRPLAWLAHPASLWRRLWTALLRLCELLRFSMRIFEQRYYLLGVLAALITVMLLMAQ